MELVTNLEKSRSQATLLIEFLGFVINSKEMVFRLSWTRVKQIKNECKEVLKRDKVTERAGACSGCPSSFSPGTFTSSAALSGSSGPEKRRSSSSPLIWINSSLECTEPRESEVVDQTP